MQICCDASVGLPRQAFDQLVIHIETIVVGGLDIGVRERRHPKSGDRQHSTLRSADEIGLRPE